MAIGGERGAISLIALAGNIITFLISIYVMAWGINPVLITLIAGVIINSITLYYQNKKNDKTKAAFLSVVITTVVLLFVMLPIFLQMHLNGLDEIELSGDLSIYYSFAIKINMELVFLCVVLICFLGAIMDTAMAVASGMYEIKANNPEISEIELFHSGITIGKDIINTTMNTLFFAYCGEALFMFLYFRKYQYKMMTIMNSKALLLNLAAIVTSGIGCIAIIPLCAKICAKLIKSTGK
ncbi:putative membrane protein [Aequitasia blattaphilus]|uniref:YibE/F family protein n=1 Tax=Aequitasia blattaphilus TaxID=2949332 RepID=A0ABT1E8X3_9FIRM|nr:YibE/F family protein [Aequitasia blattaphilus]MCR8614905.1 YibE/F family protein [Aequitasia blattaphilus]